LFQFAHDIFTDISLDQDGNLVVVGTFGNNTSAGPDIAVAKYDSDGNEFWTDEFESEELHEAIRAKRLMLKMTFVPMIWLP